MTLYDVHFRFSFTNALLMQVKVARLREQVSNWVAFESSGLLYFNLVLLSLTQYTAYFKMSPKI